MKLHYLFLTICLTWICTFAQVQKPVDKNDAVGNQPKYYQDFLNFESDRENMTRLDVFIQVPYSAVQFIRGGVGFEANYSITVTIFDESGERMITERTWNEKIETTDFNQTTAGENFNLSMRSFHLEPAKYKIRTTIEDKDSKRRYSSDNIYTVRDLNKGLAMSDPMIIAKQTIVEGSNRIIPNIPRNVPLQSEGMNLFFELYSDSPQTVTLIYKIMDSDQKIVSEYSEERNLEAGRTTAFYTIEEFPIAIGSYTINIRLFNSRQKLLSEVNKTFLSRWSGVPINISDFDKAVSQLIYIATPSELSYIEGADSQEEKIRRFMDFWKQKDPTPDTKDNPVFEEYFRRIAYSNENFSTYFEGWRSDRGMVYTILGPPSNIDRHPFNYDSKPYEIWEYYELNRRFIFLDETGFGDYRLITPLRGDSFRYRY